MCWAAAGLFRCLFFEVIRQLSHLVNVYRNISTGVEGLPIFTPSTPIPYFFTQPCHCAINQVINVSHHFSSIRTHKTNCWECHITISSPDFDPRSSILYTEISSLCWNLLSSNSSFSSVSPYAYTHNEQRANFSTGDYSAVLSDQKKDTRISLEQRNSCGLPMKETALQSKFSWFLTAW